MGKRGTINFIVCGLVMLFGVTLWAYDASAMQPYQDPRFEEVAQSSAQCGPTSFYMIFNFLGANQAFKEVNLSEHPEDMASYGYKVTNGSAICKWINKGSTSGTSWTQLKSAADKLHALSSTAAYFKTELNNKSTGTTTSGDTERLNRLNYIKTSYLDKGRAVMIHLERSYYLAGHYIVITGYDPVAGKVYYADPNGGSAGEVSQASFIHDKWYVSPSNSASYYRARWDGEWLGFYH
jgi:hypothetical protein